MIDAKIDAVLRKVGRGVAGYLDETILRGYIVCLHQRVADAEDKERRAEQDNSGDWWPCACGFAMPPALSSCRYCGRPRPEITEAVQP